MLRWLLLMILLANSLMFLWYAQQYRFSETVRNPDIRPAELRLSSELEGAEPFVARQKQCVRFLPLKTIVEAQQLVTLLDSYQLDASINKEPPRQDGVRLSIPMPADSLSRISLLDELALLGWVPEVRDGSLFLGVYKNDEEVEDVIKGLSSPLASKARVAPNVSNEERFSVAFSYLQGFEIDQQLIDLVEESWPGVGIEKKRCLGVATHNTDQ